MYICYVYTHIHVHIHVHIHKHVDMYIFIYMCIYIYIHIHIHAYSIYIYIYIYIYTHVFVVKRWTVEVHAPSPFWQSTLKVHFPGYYNCLCSKQWDPNPNKHSSIRKRCCKRRMESLTCRCALSFKGIILRLGSLCSLLSVDAFCRADFERAVN